MNHLYQKIHNIESVEKTKIYLFEKKTKNLLEIQYIGLHCFSAWQRPLVNSTVNENIVISS